VEIDGMDDAAAEHVGPEAVGQVAGELPAGGDHLGELLAAAEFGDAADGLVGGDLILLSFGEGGFDVEDGAFGEAGKGFVAGIAGEDGFEAGFAVGFFGERDLPGLGVGEERGAVKEGEQAVVVFLVVVVDERVVVALAALQVHAEGDAANVAGEEVGLGVAVEHEAGCGSRLHVQAIGSDQFTEELVERFVVG
jgi:hypothetical protein